MQIFFSRFYQFFFCSLSLYICAAPLFILEDPRDEWELSHYNIVELVSFALMLDPIFVLVFIGPRRLVKGYFYIQEISSSLALIGLSVVSDCITPIRGQTLAKTNYVFFLIYSFICFSKITRIFSTVLNELPQIKAVFSVMSNLKPFLKDLLGMEVCIFLIFAQIGINTYGGIINSNTPQIFFKATQKPLPTDFHKINFNDFPNSMVTLYNIFLKNKWMDIQNMYLISTNSRSFRYFFISFQVLATLVIMNLLIGFIVEVIMTHLNKKYSKMIKIDDKLLEKATTEDDLDDSSSEEVDEEDVYVDDEHEKDLEDRAKALADAINKGLEKNLKAMGMASKKRDKKTEAAIEMMPMI
jgi:hypothetical protein